MVNRRASRSASVVGCSPGMDSDWEVDKSSPTVNRRASRSASVVGCSPEKDSEWEVDGPAGPAVDSGFWIAQVSPTLLAVERKRSTSIQNFPKAINLNLRKTCFTNIANGFK